MLVLSRKPGESIYIGDSIEVKIIDIRGNGNSVNVGIEAPRGIPVVRDDAKKKEPREQ